MTTRTKSSKTRKPAAKPARTVHLYCADSNPMLIEMTIGEELFAYFVKRLHADYGVGFEFRKAPDGIHDYEPDTLYHVHFDPARRLSTCDCKGGNYNGHCKHQAAIVALIRSGKLPVAEAAKPEAKPKAPDCPKCGRDEHLCACYGIPDFDDP